MPRSLSPRFLVAFTLAAFTFVAPPLSAAPDENLGADVSAIIDLVQDDAAALLPFGQKPPQRVAQAAALRKGAIANLQPGTDAALSASGPDGDNKTSAGTIESGQWLRVAGPLGMMVLMLLGAVVFARKRNDARYLKVIEVTTLGRGRSMVVAQVADRSILLGVSEGGVNLLLEDLQISLPAAVTDSTTPSFFDRLFRRASRPRAFEPHLFEMTDEDDELRRKIAAHLTPGATASGIH